MLARTMELLGFFTSEKYEFASSNNTESTFAISACFVWVLYHRVLFNRCIATINAFEHVSNAANSFLTLRVPSTSLHRVILLERRLRLTRVLYGN
jgi:hypothetical protein